MTYTDQDVRELVEAARMARDYFLNGTPCKCEPEVNFVEPECAIGDSLDAALSKFQGGKP